MNEPRSRFDGSDALFHSGEGAAEEVDALLRDLLHFFRSFSREALDRFQLTPPQFSALLLILRSGSPAMGELSQQLYLASSTLTDLVRRLERNGWVRRVQDPCDRRIVRLEITPHGRSVVEEARSWRKQVLSRKLERLDPEERGLMIRQLHRLRGLLGED